MNERSAEEVFERQENVAIKDPEHLKRWLTQSGRKYIVLRSDHLIDGLRWPEGVESFQEIINQYRASRADKRTGEVRIETNEHGEEVEVAETFPETLTQPELQELIAELSRELAG